MFASVRVIVPPMEMELLKYVRIRESTTADCWGFIDREGRWHTQHHYIFTPNFNNDLTDECFNKNLPVWPFSKREPSVMLS